MMKKAMCRPYRQGDELGILALYHAVFNVDLSLQTWRWFYEQMPDGPAIIVVAENEEGVIGHYAVQPRPFWLYGLPHLAGLAVGTMVHRSARNLTTLVEMAHLAYDLCRKRGLPFLYAFPNDLAWRIRQVVLGWQPLPQLIEWEGPLLLLTGLPESQTQIWRGLSVEDLAHLSLPIDTDDHNAICGRRTSTWLHWRFFQKPSAEYMLHLAGSLDNVQGYAVLKQYARSGIQYGHILDWQVVTRDTSVARDLFVSVWKQFAAWGVKRVSCWAPPKLSLVPQLHKAGLTLTGRKTNFGYFNLSLESDVALADEGAWEIYMADSDIY